MLPDIQFANPVQKEEIYAAGTKFSQFVVVNDPQPEQSFETFRPLENFTIPAGKNPADYITTAKNEFINTPDFKVLIQTQNATVEQKTLHDNNDSRASRIDNSSLDTQKASIEVTNYINYNVPMAYVNRFHVSFSVNSDLLYQFANGTNVTYQSNINGIDYCLYDNIPVTVLFNNTDTGPVDDIPQLTYTTGEGAVSVIYQIYNFAERFNLQYQKDNDLLYKFEVIDLNANSSSTSKVFENSTHSYLHVIEGNATIEDYSVGLYEFYKHDATQSVVINAGPDGAVIVQLSKVSELTLP